jgi:nitroreductase
MNEVRKALQFRHACKKFDPEKTIPGQTLTDILECARLSPSSFGMEPWKFLVIRNTDKREALKKACWDQPQITDSSEVIVILDKKNLTRPGSDYISQQFSRRNLPADAQNAYLERYRQHYLAEIEPLMSNYAWDSKQCYIALSNIMTAAAATGVDSCPIEGFNKQEVEQALALNTEKYEVVVLVALGYRSGEQTPRLRLSFEEVVEFIE